MSDLNKIASPVVMGMYFKECKKHNVSPLLLTKVGEMQKKEGAIGAVLGGAALLATLYDYLSGNAQDKQIADLQRQVADTQEEKEKKPPTDAFNLDNSTIGGGIVGGGLGTWLGPKIMPKTDPTNAMIIGGLGGALAGGAAGSYLGKKITI